MSHNAASASDYYHLPVARTQELDTLIRFKSGFELVVGGGHGLMEGIVGSFKGVFASLGQAFTCWPAGLVFS